MSGPSFRFRLERVRALRQRTEEEATQALAGAMLRHRLSEEKLQSAAASAQRAREEHLAAAALPSSAGDMLARQAYLERTQRERLSQEHELAQRALEVAGRRDALGVAARERKSLERLKEQRRAEHAREALRLENQTLDEIALNAFRRSAA